MDSSGSRGIEEKERIFCIRASRRKILNIISYIGFSAWESTYPGSAIDVQTKTN